MKVIKTANYKKIASKGFVGNCVNGLEDPYFQDKIAEDATELAQLVENGQQINLQDFFNMTGLLDHETIQKLTNDVTNNFEYFYNVDRGIVWYYDNAQDIEYFYI
jgi:hypothetical protein